jgi:hypothetical protein
MPGRQVTTHGTVYRRLIFNRKKQCDKRVRRPVKKPGRLTIVLSEREAFKLTAWELGLKATACWCQALKGPKSFELCPQLLQ